MPFEAPLPTLPAPVVETEAQRLIRLAKERIATPDRWTKGAYFHNDAACLRGAFRVALGGAPGVIDAGLIDAESNRCVAYPYMVAAIREACPGFLGPDTLAFSGRLRSLQVEVFNDDKHTTHADVLAVLDRAYALAAEQT